MRGIKSAHRGLQGFSKCQRSKSNYSWCNPPTYALTSKGVTMCLFTLWKGLIPFTKLQHRRRPMSGYIRLCKVIYGYVRLCKVICGYGALVEWPWNVGRRSRDKPGMRGYLCSRCSSHSGHRAGISFVLSAGDPGSSPGWGGSSPQWRR